MCNLVRYAMHLSFFRVSWMLYGWLVKSTNWFEREAEGDRYRTSSSSTAYAYKHREASIG